MDRRESLKSLLIGGVAGVTLTSGACRQDSTDLTDHQIDSTDLYGRTPAELEHDKKISAEKYLTHHELETIAVLCDIILPATATAGSATDAEVPEFIDFIVKDLPHNKIPMRGGLMWLDSESRSRYNQAFKDLSDDQQIAIVDDIAYPDPDGKKPGMGPGIKFFSLMRNLTLTGYYTSKTGIRDLGYKGNTPNLWDGVPDEVLQNHDVPADPGWLSKCIDHNKREVIAEWDEDGNLLT